MGRGESHLNRPKRTLPLLAAALLVPLGLVGLAQDAAASHGNAIILVLDNDETIGNANAARTSLLNAGYQECAAVAASQHAWNCFEMVRPSAYCSTLTQAGRRVLYVGENPSLAAFGALYTCRNTLASWTAQGGCVVAWNENNGGDVWDWTPRSVFNQYPLWTNAAGNDVTKTAAGNAHIATAGVTLSGWSQSYHQYFRNPAPFMTSLAYRGGNTANPVVLTWPNGNGGVLIAGLDADTHNNGGNLDARRFVKQSVEWALECSCDKPTGIIIVREQVEAELPIVGEVLDGLGFDVDVLVEALLGPAQSVAPGAEAGGAYVTEDGAVYLESNGEPGLQRWSETEDPGFAVDTRVA